MCVCVHVCVCMCVCEHACLVYKPDKFNIPDKYVYVNSLVSSVHLYVCVCIRMCVCMCVCVCACMFCI